MTTSITTTSFKTYSYSCFIPFHLADPAGILFFSHVFTLFHQAFECFIIDRFQSWNSWFQNPDWIVPIKHATADYYSPLHAGKECLLELSIDKISTTSFKMKTLFYQTEQLCCTTHTVHVFCDRSNQQKIPIPPSLRSFLTVVDSI